MTTGICVKPSEELEVREEAKRRGLKLSEENLICLLSSDIALEVIGERNAVTAFYHWVWEEQSKGSLS